MNFLAHLHLSYPNSAEMVGNFIGDDVKGRQFMDYPTDISRGIQLHRRIDTFTDTHPLQKKCKSLFAQEYGLYAGIITDMLFDHLLAKNWRKYATISLQYFTQQVYQTLSNYSAILPQRVQFIIPKMKAANRLQSYATLEGIAEAIHLMTRYTSLPDHTAAAVVIIQNNLPFLETNFNAFYLELIVHVSAERESI